MSQKIVYVTGCLGFIGSHVTRACLKQGWYVIGVDKMTYAAREEYIEHFTHIYGPRFKFIKSDINDLTDLYDCDYIINTAAETHVDNSIANSDEFIKSNINGVHNLLKLMNQKQNKPVLIHFSTDEVYGDIVNGSHTETDLLKPSNPYSASKASADMLVLAWARTFKISYVIVRPTNNYGEAQYVEKLIPKACKYFQLGKLIPLHNRGNPKRVWLHVEDTANAIIKIIKSEIVNEIYNISGNCELKNIEIIEKILKTGNYTSPTPYDDYLDYFCDFSYERSGQDLRYSLDDSKLKKLGWQCEKNFDEELPKIVEYYKENFIW